MQDTKQDAMQHKQETDLINSLQDLTLGQNQNTPKMIDTTVPPLYAPEMNHEVEEAKGDDMIIAYNMNDQEVRLQHKEEKYEVYMSTSGYKGDDSDLDSKTDTNSDATAYPFLG